MNPRICRYIAGIEESFRRLAAMSSSFKLVTFCFVVLSISILVTNNIYFTINYTRRLHDNVTGYLTSLGNTELLEVVSMDIISKRVETGLVETDPTRDKAPETPYLKSKRNPPWFEVVSREFKNEAINIGLVNVDDAVDGVQTKGKMVRVHFERVGEELRWSDLSPELRTGNATCPNVPMPKFEDYKELDVVVARISRGTGYGDDGLKDVSMLQVNLIVANLLVRSGRKGGPLLAVFVESLNPMREIFRCDDLLWNEGNTWIYKPERTRIKKLVRMPVGPCEYVPPPSDFSDFDREKRGRRTSAGRPPQPREAYVTILHSSEIYVCGAIVLAQSIIQTNTTKDLILLADDNISAESISALIASGWKTHRISRIRSPYSKKDTYNEWNYSKLRIWELKLYDKLMFIDADLVVTSNIDEFFAYPELSAVGNYQKHLFNSGLMVVEPSQCTFDALMEKMEVVESYNGGDQGFLNEMFVWWHRLPHEINFMKVFLEKDDLVHAIDKGVQVVHYTGLKPWTCTEEERDCNWDSPEFHKFASNSAHRMWWRVYRAMPENLRLYCLRN